MRRPRSEARPVARRRHAAAWAVAVAAMTVAPAGGSVPRPDDPLFPKQWNLPLIQIPDAWAVSKGAGATVAVLDTGVAYENYDDGRFSFRKLPGFSRTRFAPGYDFVDGDEHPNDGLGEDPERAAHGTHTAAVIAETSGEGKGTASVAPGATIMPVRVLDWDGNGQVDAIANGIRYAADHGAEVIVMSLAGTDTGPVADAVAYAAGKGVIMVAPSGNQGEGRLRFPASMPEVISVGAVTADRDRASYSNFGEGLDLVAPGGDVSRDLTGDGEPDGIRQGTFVGRLDGFCFCQKDGTSSAAPHVGGVAALLVASGLATTPEQVRRALVSSALDLGPPGPDPYFGAGLVQAADALAAAARAAADLALTIEPAGAPGPDGAVTATLAVTNRGPVAGTGVVLTDTLPAGTAVTSVTASQGSCTTSGPTTVTCDLADVPVGARATVTLVATAAGELRHDAGVRGNEGDGNRADNRVGPPAPPPAGEQDGAEGGGGGASGVVLAGVGVAVLAIAGPAAAALVRRRGRSRPAPRGGGPGASSPPGRRGRS